MKNILLSFISFVCMYIGQAKAQQVIFSTQIQPNPVPLGTKTYLIVTANHLLNNVQFNLPIISNLNLKFERKSSQTRIINGQTEQATTWYFSITPTKIGTFIIPEFSATINDSIYMIPATRVEVNAPSNNVITNTNEIYLTLNNTIPQKWYVGQCVPCKINLLTPPNIRGQLLSLIQKVGDAFSASHLIDAPQKHSMEIQGKTFACLSWPTLLCSLQSGQHTLSFNINLEIEHSRRQSSLFDSNDPLDALRQISSIFDTAEPITITSQTYTINVLPLPTPQPETFSQGIGHFNLTNPAPQTKEFIQDEPFSYSVKISGSGNFDNIQAPNLIYDASQWRVYDPKSNFIPKDDLGYSGEMHYTYTIVPLSSGSATLPQISFCFFDPIQGKYETLTRQALNTITIKPPLRKPHAYQGIITPNNTNESPSEINFDTIFIDKVIWEKPSSIKHFQIIYIILALGSIIIAYLNLRNKYDQNYKTKKLAEKKFKNLYNATIHAFKTQDGKTFYAATYQLLSHLLQMKGAQHITSLLQGFKKLSIKLNDEQQQWLTQSEAFYQESNFGYSQCQCPENIIILKQLLKLLK